MGFLLLVLLILVIAYFSAGIKIIQQEEAMIIEKLGAFEKVLYAGFHIIIPFFEYPRKFNGNLLKEDLMAEHILFIQKKQPLTFVNLSWISLVKM